jgi:hypothetical protein
MTFVQMLKQDNESEIQHDLAFDTSLSNLSTDLVIPMNPSAGHQDEPVDPVTE